MESHFSMTYTIHNLFTMKREGHGRAITAQVGLQTALNMAKDFIVGDLGNFYQILECPFGTEDCDAGCASGIEWSHWKSSQSSHKLLKDALS